MGTYCYLNLLLESSLWGLENYVKKQKKRGTISKQQFYFLPQQ